VDENEVRVHFQHRLVVGQSVLSGLDVSEGVRFDQPEVAVGLHFVSVVLQIEHVELTLRGSRAAID
jgi:hypothetical protein